MDTVIINIGRGFDERVGMIEAQPVGAHLPDAIVLSKDDCARAPLIWVVVGARFVLALMMYNT